MKRKIISGIKIYTCCILYLLLTVFIYSFYLMKTNNNSNKIIELILGITTFILLGILYGNMIHKRGLIIGFVTGMIHLLILYLIFYLSTGSFQFKIFPFIIYLISSSLGGVLGMSFKKII